MTQHAATSAVQPEHGAATQRSAGWPGSYGRLTAAVLLALLAAASGCSDGLARGAHCVASSQCVSNLCYANKCWEPSADDDGDGLTAGQEQRIGTDPAQADSDADGKADGSEVGPDRTKPLDADGDGKPDAVESALLDQDGDCLPDELDAHDGEKEADMAVLVQLVCSRGGVCAQATKLITATCTAAVLACNYTQVPGWQAVEVCDGVDNDCDGLVDEGYVYQGQGVGLPCSGVGGCGVGVVVCVSGHATCSTNPDGSQSRAKPESCNGVDDDCDGDTDEDFTLAGLSIGAPCLGVGECGIGAVACGKDGQPRCSADPGGADSLASPEVCNGLDDNCDGQTDEGLTLGGQPLGGPCTVSGVCGAGVVQCNAKSQTTCSTAPGQPQSPAAEELCNGKDDDCDGKTDEGFAMGKKPLGAPCMGIGQCGAGVVACSKAGGVTCSSLSDGPDSQAKPEVCNGKDDDCDGLTDEKLTWQGKPLGAKCGGQGICGAGTVVCGKNSTATCSTLADGTSSQAKKETCNGIDDDCDGVTDNDPLPPVGLGCSGVGVCQSLVGAPACIAAQWVCSFAGQPGFEGPGEVSCDGQDNDCDGKTDEGLANVWKDPTPWEDGRPLARRLLAWGMDSQGGVWIAGGLESGPAGTEVAARDAWRFDTATGLWKAVVGPPLPARSGAGLWLATSTSGQVAKAVLLGGQDEQGQPGQTVELDVATGQWVQGALPEPPTPVGAATASEVLGQVWLFGAPIGGGPALVQRFNVAQGAWEGGVPQPLGQGAQLTACAMAGTWYALSVGSGGQAGLSSLGLGATTWQTLSTKELPDNISQLGTLTCWAKAAEVWWLGASGPNGAALAPMRYLPAAAKWLPIADGTLPSRRAPVVAGVGQSLVLLFGLDSAGLPREEAFVRTGGIWSLADAEPPTAVGATWLPTPTGLLRIGGMVPRGNKLAAIAGAWRHAGGAWQWLPMPELSAGRGLAEAMQTSTANQVVFWGGTPSLQPDQLASTASLTVASGAHILDLVTGTWTAAPMATVSALAPIKPDSASTPTLESAQRYFFTAGSGEGAAELWNQTWNQGKTLVWKTGDSPGPGWKRGTAITYDPLSNRIVLAQVDGKLNIWAMTLGSSLTWQLEASDPSVTAGRVILVGTPGYPDRLLLVLQPSGAGPATGQILNLSQATVSLNKWAGTPPPWVGQATQAWTGDWATLEGQDTLDGRYQTRRVRFGYSCGP